MYQCITNIYILSELLLRRGCVVVHINILACLLGVLCGGLIRCPWHGACFSVNNGDIEDFPGVDSIPKFDVCCCHVCLSFVFHCVICTIA